MAEQLRGLAFPGNGVPLEQPVPALFNISERADLAVATYGSLGLVADKAEALDGFTASFQALHDSLAGEYGSDEPALEPFIGIELNDNFGFMALKSAFDKRQAIETYIDHPIWDQVSLDELNRRSLDGAAKTARATSGINGQALAMVLGGDRTDSPGLYFISKNLKDQIKAVRTDRINFSKNHSATERLLINPADTIVLNAQRREAGQDLLDGQTFGRYVQIDKKSALGDSWVPRSGSHGGRLRFRGSDDVARSGGGVRLSVGQTEA